MLTFVTNGLVSARRCTGSLTVSSQTEQQHCGTRNGSASVLALNEHFICTHKNDIARCLMRGFECLHLLPTDYTGRQTTSAGVAPRCGDHFVNHCHSGGSCEWGSWTPGSNTVQRQCKQKLNMHIGTTTSSLFMPDSSPGASFWFIPPNTCVMYLCLGPPPPRLQRTCDMQVFLHLLCTAPTTIAHAQILQCVT